MAVSSAYYFAQDNATVQARLNDKAAHQLVDQPPAIFDPPLSFHVYKAGGIFCKDDIITHDDKTQVQYYLEFPLKFFGGWDLTLHRGGKEGPLVARVQKGSFGSDFRFTLANGWVTQMVRTGFFTKTHQFAGFDGRSLYKWKSDGAFSSNWTCFNTEKGDEVVATWRRSTWAVTKDGQLLISPSYVPEAELILATALALEEWRREERKRRSRNNA